MSDIARIAGVSESTVSRALKGSTLVSEETRKRIQAIAEEQHYVVNQQAQNLRTQSSRTVLVVLPIDHEPHQHVSDPFFLELLGSIADALTAQDYDVLLSRVHRRDWRARVTSHSYARGMIMIGQSDLHDEINEFTQRLKMPMVVWGAKFSDQQYATVGSDNYAGGELATAHLLSQGCRKIAFLGDHSLPEIRLRHRGYLAALAREGIYLPEQYTQTVGFSREGAIQGAKALIDSQLDVDAVFAASDVIASCVVSSLLKQNRRVPDDVKVVGYDDIAMAATMVPAITTVSQDLYGSGQLLVDNLLQQLNGGPARSVIVPPKLVVRDTA